MISSPGGRSSAPPLYHLSRVTSTMDVAREWVNAGRHAPPFWVLADEQTAGRGRQGRGWRSLPGNLHATGVFATARPLHELPSLALVAGLAVIDTVIPQLMQPDRLRLKWPNDVLLGERKLAGILCESERRERDALVLVGIGVNLAHAPRDVDLPATALASEGVVPPAPETFLFRLARVFAHLQQSWEASGFAALKARYEQWMWGRGQKVVISDETAGEGRIAGELAGIDEDGALLLETAAGRVRVVSGRLRLHNAPSHGGRAP